MKLWPAHAKPIANPLKFSLDDLITSPTRTVSYLSADGAHLIAIGNDETLRIWNGAMLEPSRRIATKDSIVAAMSSGGEFLALGDRQGRIHVHTQAGNPARIWQAHEGSVCVLQFSPNGKMVASLGAGGEWRLWDRASAKLLTILPTKSRGDAGVAFSPDSAVLAVANANATVELWETGSLRKRAEFVGHTARAFALRFSPDGEVLASGAADGKTKLWSLKTLREMATLSGVFQAVHCLTFSAD